MSNHARGLWGYSGRAAGGERLTIQATGMGGPSAALVVADLAKLGVERAVRVGTCAGFGPRARAGELLLVAEAVSAGGSGQSFGVAAGATVLPDPELLKRLRDELAGRSRDVVVASLDTLPAKDAGPENAAAADMQTVAVLASARTLGVAAAAVLIAREVEDEELSDDALEAAARKAGRAAATALI